METITIFKQVYVKAFEQLKQYQLYVLKGLSYIVLAGITLGIAAFIYRVSTGFFVI
ncbi:DUF6747 family protein [Spongiivirga citrea]|uniref:Uncharacterized protein n=1 Tax=Spongiivirga citrea TaxID=1481457 RepID=A0A6M0CHZ4_9FLAO|nr:DUF6747 family protein [Spongiivirga citrea]NER17481.1 hypothetical protein [Spongiivirga citrea]